MGSGALPLILLLMSFIHAGLTQVRPVVKVTPDQRVFRGETVTLTCDIQGAGHIQWRYSWFKDGDTQYPVYRTTAAEYSFTAYESYSGEYSCQRSSYSQISHISAAVTLTVSDLPTPTLTVTPDSPVFTGETVNLTCVIESHSDWTYEWYKGSGYYSVKLQLSDRYTVNRDTLTIRGVIIPDAGQYWCRGQIRSVSPQSSSYVYLSVKDSPRSTLTVTPKTIFTGETVTLTCVIESYSDWRYEWNKDSVMLQSSDRYTVNRDTLTIRGATESDQGQYWCRGQRDERPKSSQSSSVSLSVKDSPRSTLTVTPDSPVFTGETVNLKCVIETYRDWRYEWYKYSVMLQRSDRYTVNRDTLTIRRATESDQGQYWCRGQRDERPQSSQSSSAFSLTVIDLPTSKVTVTPDSPVFTGETVNLTCVIRSYSDWRYEWYKDSVMLQSSDLYTVNRDTLTIRGATESDQGQYWCRGQRDEGPQSSQDSNRINLSVNVSRSGQISVFNILSFLLAACPYLLSTVVLLFKCYRERESHDAGV